MDPLEVVAAAFGVISVWLSTREHIASWPTALVNTGLYFLVLQRAHLYANAWLQVFYFVLSCYGWYHWAFGGKEHQGIEVSRTSATIAWRLVAVATAATALIYLVLTRYTDTAMPLLDASTTAVSLAAQWMLTQKLRANWGVWSAVNVVYIWMYASAGLWPTVALYIAFLLLALHGWRAWGEILRAREALTA